MVFGLPLCSVYCNTLLANLNARSYIRGETTTLNTDADLCTSSTSRPFDGTGGDKHRASRVVSLRRSGGFSQSMLVRLSDDDGHARKLECGRPRRCDVSSWQPVYSDVGGCVRLTGFGDETLYSVVPSHLYPVGSSWYITVTDAVQRSHQEFGTSPGLGRDSWLSQKA